MFFWQVLYMFRGDFAEDLVVEATEKRAAELPKKDLTSSILNIGVAKEWGDILLEQPFNSSK